MTPDSLAAKTRDPRKIKLITLRDELLDAFNDFWGLYPRRVAKKAAEKAWSRIATSPEVIEQIMAGLRAQLPAMMKQERKFIPHPSTWLNQRRFEDEQASIKPPDERVIACPKCGDTGAVIVNRGPVRGHIIEECDCPIGRLPGVLAGVEEAI